MGNMISLSEPVLGEPEKDALARVIDSGWLTMGQRVREFETAFAEIHDVEDAVAVSSCTAGLHLILEALGIGPGDEVLVPSLTFVATVNAVLYAGATPVFVDIESDKIPHISLKAAEDKCTERTRAVIVMHYGGYLVDITKWRSFADRQNLYFIEDAAHAPGGKGVGLSSHAAAFSFFTNKNMTTAEGGMVVSQDSDVIKRIRSMRSHGMTSLTLDRYKGHAYSYDVTTLGYNYRIDELRAAMGLVQLARLSEWNRKRRELTHVYRTFLKDLCPGVTVPFDDEWPTTAHLMPILLPGDIKRTDIMDKLRAAGIQSSIHYPPVHGFSYHKKRFPNVILPETESYCDRIITLPLHPALGRNDVEYVVTRLNRALG